MTELCRSLEQDDAPHPALAEELTAELTRVLCERPPQGEAVRSSA